MSSSPRQSQVLRMHQWIYETTRGFVGHRLLGVPTLLLTATGRRTGSARTVALVYAKDTDGALVVTASNGGNDRPPAWLHNVAACAAVNVQIARHNFHSRAEVISPDHNDYARLWILINRNTRGRYDRYQHRTSRQFDLVKLRLNPPTR